MSTERVDLAGARWITSSRSGSSGNQCVEVAGVRDGVAVRDSKDRDGAVLRVSRTAWATFVADTCPEPGA